MMAVLDTTKKKSAKLMYPVYKTHLAKIEGAIVWPYSMF